MWKEKIADKRIHIFIILTGFNCSYSCMRLFIFTGQVVSPKRENSLPVSMRSYMKHEFHVFDHDIKTFERDKHLGFASRFISFSCFHIMIKHWNLCFSYIT